MGSEVGEKASESFSEEQEFLRQCEEEFGNRFTEEDAEFSKLLKQPQSNPPVIDPWYDRAPRNFHHGRKPYDRDRGGDRDGDRDRYRYRGRDRDRDRDRDSQNHRSEQKMYRHRDNKYRPY